MNATTMKTIKIELGGETRWATEETWQAEADALHAVHGGVPKVTREAPISDTERPPPSEEPVPDPFAGSFKSVAEMHANPAKEAEHLARVYGAGATMGTMFGAPEHLPAAEREPGIFPAPTAARAAGALNDALSGVPGPARAPLRLVAPQPADPEPQRRAPPRVGLGTAINEEGRARSQADYEAAVAAGFSPKQPYYERGTEVIATGVANARKFRKQWEAMPLTTEGCASLIDTVRAEDRRNIDVRVRDMGMTPAAELDFYALGEQMKRPMTPTAFSGFCSRLGFGGAQYLAKCWPELRAHNVNEWLTKLVTDEKAEEVAAAVAASASGKASKFRAQELRLRDRKNAGTGGREVFGTVTDSYTDWDIDKVAEAVRRACPPDARGRVTYDGDKARIEILFHSTVKPEHYVAGEFFRAGVVIRTDDTGGGSIGGSAYVWQNLCLNLICIDKAATGTFRIRHMGSLDSMVQEFQAGFGRALTALEHFQKSWGYAVEENAVDRALKAVDETLVGVPVHEAMPWIFRGIVERELVPVFAKREDAVPKLMAMWQKDESSATSVHRGSRAAIVNAFTRYAHEAAELDAWQEDEIQRTAGLLLQPRGRGAAPAPLPYMTDEEAAKK